MFYKHYLKVWTILTSLDDLNQTSLGNLRQYYSVSWIFFNIFFFAKQTLDFLCHHFKLGIIINTGLILQKNNKFFLEIFINVKKNPKSLDNFNKFRRFEPDKFGSFQTSLGNLRQYYSVSWIFFLIWIFC